MPLPDPVQALSQLIAYKMATAQADPRHSPKVKGWDYDPSKGTRTPLLDYHGAGYGSLPPVPESQGFKPKPFSPVPIPQGVDLQQAESLDAPAQEGDWTVDAERRLGNIGASLSDVNRVDKDWGSGYIASGQVGNAKPVSSTTRFGTATFAPGTFMVGAADPRRREFLTQRGVAQSEKSRRELSDFLNINAPTGTRDNYGTTNPMEDSRIRAGRAEAAAKANALAPLPTVSVDDPQQVELAGGQAAYNAQKLAEAKLAAAVSPVGQQAQDQDTRARAIAGAAPYAMQIDAGSDARDAFLQFLFPTLQKQGASADDLAFIAKATGASPEEVAALMAEQGIKVR